MSLVSNELAKDLAESVVWRTKSPFLMPVLLAVFGWGLDGQVGAQTVTTLHTFARVEYDNTLQTRTNSDGIQPRDPVIIAAKVLYGAAPGGGSTGNGTVFRLNTDGTGFVVLHSFSALGPGSYGTNSDGAQPRGPVIGSDNALYGVGQKGGSTGNGTAFKLNSDGTGFTILHSFGGYPSDGSLPTGLILSGSTLYGSTAGEGGAASGTVFTINTDGTGYKTLHDFSATVSNPSGVYTNSEGAAPTSGLVLAGSIIYGTTYEGGPSGNGTVFAVNTDGTGFGVLHSFSALSGAPVTIGTNYDGAAPLAGLRVSGNTLYGTARFGGSSGHGTVFAVNTDGNGFTVLHNFTAAPPPSFTNTDGADPYSSLAVSGNTIYGTAAYGGISDSGTVFTLSTDGRGFMSLYTFTALSNSNPGINSEGATPLAGLTVSASTLYGAAGYGGDSGYGTLFSISFTPQLTITPVGPNVVVSWPTSFAGFRLQSTTNLASPVWTTNLPTPVIVNGQFTATNPVSGTQQFFRLSR